MLSAPLFVANGGTLHRRSRMPGEPAGSFAIADD